MAGLFMCLAFPRGLLGFDFGSQSCIPWLPSEFHQGLQSRIPLLPSEFHLGFYLESLCFHLSSIWDSILNSFASV